jgi:hypothetical protein
MVVRRKIVHLLKIVLAGKSCFKNCRQRLALTFMRLAKKMSGLENQTKFKRFLLPL